MPLRPAFLSAPCIAPNDTWRKLQRRENNRLPLSLYNCQPVDINGIQQDVRRLTVSVYERAVESAIGRGLLGSNGTDDPWAVVSALFASMFDDHTIEWLNKRGYLNWAQRGQAEPIIAAVNTLIGRQR